MNCINCHKEYPETLDSKLMWKFHEGFLSLTLCQEPAALHTTADDHPTDMCINCSITILSGLLKVEIEHVNETFMQ